MKNKETIDLAIELLQDFKARSARLDQLDLSFGTKDVREGNEFGERSTEHDGTFTVYISGVIKYVGE